MSPIVIPCESKINLIGTEGCNIHLTLKTICTAQREGKKIKRSKCLGVAPADVLQIEPSCHNERRRVPGNTFQPCRSEMRTCLARYLRNQHEKSIFGSKSADSLHPDQPSVLFLYPASTNQRSNVAFVASTAQDGLNSKDSSKKRQPVHARCAPMRKATAPKILSTPGFSLFFCSAFIFLHPRRAAAVR